MKRISLFAVLVGLLFLIYPALKDHVTEYQQEKLMTAWTESLQNMNSSGSDILVKSTAGVGENTNAIPEKPLNSIVENKSDSKPENLKFNDTMDGILTIEKINLRLPILRGASTANMQLSVASIIGTGKIGQVGNYCIAGHRSYAYGKNFNRLDELTTGDIVKITTANRQYQYEVTEKLYVKPTDVWVLSGDEKSQEVSLITCHPMINPTQRLVVRAKILPF